MGVYVFDMKMPRSCNECRFAVNGFCRASPKLAVGGAMSKRDRTNYCPLIPVPPHGRLIDTSEKIRVQLYDDMTEDFHMVEMTIEDLLSQGWVEAVAPTIIPADLAEEGE